MALMQALCLFLLIPAGFANVDLRVLVAALLGQDPASYSPGRMTYDLRRWRAKIALSHDMRALTEAKATISSRSA
jgi:hypothetical protein